ncbi:hypothetical protein [Bradyrhizobium sp.]|uniref:hypothetical protein n=1 Tax=Bradyrhizobium sp. TaxID=376 RepID=UPI00262F45FA|nr:hypothetical protein [Bradyrhizobium sp.]
MPPGLQSGGATVTTSHHRVAFSRLAGVTLIAGIDADAIGTAAPATVAMLRCMAA